MLTVINGGGGGKGGKPKSQSPPEPPKEEPFRKHHLADDLWQALAKPATSIDELRERIGKTKRGRKPSRNQLGACMYHIREHADNYGWAVPIVAKGRSNELRLYFRVLVEGDFIVTEYYEELRAGIKSAAATMGTMAGHTAVCLKLAIGAKDLTRTQKQRLKAMEGTLRGLEAMAEELLKEFTA